MPLKPSRGELPILQAATDLIKWFVPLLNGLRRDQKFALGDPIISNLYAVLEALVEHSPLKPRQVTTIFRPASQQIKERHHPV
jgi:hypothetical protein